MSENSISETGEGTSGYTGSPFPHRKNLRTFTGPPTAAGDVSLRAAGCGPSTDVAEAPRPAR